MYGAKSKRRAGYVEIHHDKEQKEHARQTGTYEVQSVLEENDIAQRS